MSDLHIVTADTNPFTLALLLICKEMHYGTTVLDGPACKAQQGLVALFAGNAEGRYHRKRMYCSVASMHKNRIVIPEWARASFYPIALNPHCAPTGTKVLTLATIDPALRDALRVCLELHESRMRRVQHLERLQDRRMLRRERADARA